MSEYKKLEPEEIQELAQKIKYCGEFNLKEVCDGIIDFFGGSATKAILNIGGEYNDEGYDLEITSIEVFDIENKEIKIQEDREDKYYDWKYSLISGECGREEGNSEIVIDITNQKIIGVPDLYVKI